MRDDLRCLRRGQRNKLRREWWQWMAAILLVLAAAPVGAQSYYLEDLGTLGGNTSVAAAINDTGDVVGWALANSGPGTSRAFRWSSGVIQDLGSSVSSGTPMAAAGISNSGQAAGWELSYGMQHAEVWTKNGPQPLNGPAGSLESWAFGISDAQQLAGAAVLDSFNTTHAILWTVRTPSPVGGGYGGYGSNPSYASQDLGTLGGRNSQANAINAAGLVVGSSSTADGEEHAFQWTKDGMKDLGTLGGDTSIAYALNNTAPAAIVGLSTTKTGDQHACRWSQDGMKDLGSLPDCPESVASGINDAGQIVGTVCPDGDANSERAFLYTDDKGMTDLNSPVFQRLGWHLSEARAINNKGQIVGWGTRNSQQHAFRLTPLPPTDSVAP